MELKSISLEFKRNLIRFQLILMECNSISIALDGFKFNLSWSQMEFNSISIDFKWNLIWYEKEF